MSSVEHKFERALFASRWLLTPFYIGLVISVLLLMFKFFHELAHLISTILTLTESEVMVGVLTLIDLSLIANLLFIIIFSGYESFVSKLDVSDHEDKPDWIGKVDFTGLKIKLIGSIVAISAIELLKVYINLANYETSYIQWKVTIMVAFVISGVLLALMDKLSSGSH